MINWENVTPLHLIEELMRIYDAQDYAAMGSLADAYRLRRYGDGSAKENILIKEIAKQDLDTIAQLADETRSLGTPERAVAAVREGFSTEIGPIRQFYRLAVVYEPAI